VPFIYGSKKLTDSSTVTATDQNMKHMFHFISASARV